MNIALIICIPITAIVVGFLVLKSVQLGLKWQVQVAEKKEPEFKTPIDTIKEVAQENNAKELNKQREQFLREISPF